MNLSILSSEEFLDYLSWGMLDLSECNPRELADKIQQCCDESFMGGDTEGYSRGEKESDEYHTDEYSKLETQIEELQGERDEMREHKDEAERCLELARRDYLELKADLESCTRCVRSLRGF